MRASHDLCSEGLSWLKEHSAFKDLTATATTEECPLSTQSGR